MGETGNATSYFVSPAGGLRADLQDRVLTVTIDRPTVRNAMNEDAWFGLAETLRQAETDEDVRCLVLTGAGGVFSSGADISGAPKGHPLNRIRRLGRIGHALFSFPKPTIARVEGYAVGAGWSLALCCDLVAAADDAKFSAIFSTRGLSPDVGASWMLPHLAGLQQAKRLAFLAEFITAEEAKELGLVTWTRPAAELGEFVDQIAARIASLPPIALAQTKELMNASATRTFAEAVDEEARAQAVNYATEDTPRAMAAFRDKSTPEFTGRWAIE